MRYSIIYMGLLLFYVILTYCRCNGIECGTINMCPIPAPELECECDLLESVCVVFSRHTVSEHLIDMFVTASNIIKYVESTYSTLITSIEFNFVGVAMVLMLTENCEWLYVNQINWIQFRLSENPLDIINIEKKIENARITRLQPSIALNGGSVPTIFSSNKR